MSAKEIAQFAIVLVMIAIMLIIVILGLAGCASSRDVAYKQSMTLGTMTCTVEGGGGNDSYIQIIDPDTVIRNNE